MNAYLKEGNEARDVNIEMELEQLKSKENIS